MECRRPIQAYDTVVLRFNLCFTFPTPADARGNYLPRSAARFSTFRSNSQRKSEHDNVLRESFLSRPSILLDAALVPVDAETDRSRPRDTTRREECGELSSLPVQWLYILSPIKKIFWIGTPLRGQEF